MDVIEITLVPLIAATFEPLLTPAANKLLQDTLLVQLKTVYHLATLLPLLGDARPALIEQYLSTCYSEFLQHSRKAFKLSADVPGAAATPAMIPAGLAAAMEEAQGAAEADAIRLEEEKQREETQRAAAEEKVKEEKEAEAERERQENEAAKRREPAKAAVKMEIGGTQTLAMKKKFRRIQAAMASRNRDAPPETMPSVQQNAVAEAQARSKERGRAREQKKGRRTGESRERTADSSRTRAGRNGRTKQTARR